MEKGRSKVKTSGLSCDKVKTLSKSTEKSKKKKVKSCKKKGEKPTCKSSSSPDEALEPSGNIIIIIAITRLSVGGESDAPGRYSDLQIGFSPYYSSNPGENNLHKSLSTGIIPTLTGRTTFPRLSTSACQVSLTTKHFKPPRTLVGKCDVTTNVVHKQSDNGSAFSHTLRWEFALDDEKAEEERIKVYKSDRRKRYLDAMKKFKPEKVTESLYQSTNMARNSMRSNVTAQV